MARRITITWGKAKKPAARPAKYGKAGKGAGTCGCGRGLPAGRTACPRCAAAGQAAADKARAAGRPRDGWHDCPDGKRRQTRQGICPGPWC